MKRLQNLAISIVALGTMAGALASDAQTSATAANGRYQQNGTASATAHYQGDVGFARTQSNSGRISTARGVAVGVDEQGVSLSISNAIAPRSGPALATTFNLSIGTDGHVSGSTGRSVATGSQYQSVSAGGGSGTGLMNHAATAFATGRTDRFGRVQAKTSSVSIQPRPLPVQRSYRPRPLPVPVRQGNIRRFGR
ncbi:MAG: hypothetical protein ABIG44_10925 [Planctomycetota bacterium]